MLSLFPVICTERLHTQCYHEIHLAACSWHAGRKAGRNGEGEPTDALVGRRERPLRWRLVGGHWRRRRDLARATDGDGGRAEERRRARLRHEQSCRALDVREKAGAEQRGGGGGEGEGKEGKASGTSTPHEQGTQWE